MASVSPPPAQSFGALGSPGFRIYLVTFALTMMADTLEVWHAMVLLVLHGCAGVLWITSSQVLLYDIVGPAMLPSAVRLAAIARYLGLLVGPGVGSIVMLTLGTTYGILFNAVFYVPL